MRVGGHFRKWPQSGRAGGRVDTMFCYIPFYFLLKVDFFSKFSKKIDIDCIRNILCFWNENKWKNWKKVEGSARSALDPVRRVQGSAVSTVRLSEPLRSDRV